MNAESSRLVFSQKIPDLVRQRYSCRTYQTDPLAPTDLKELEDYLTLCQQGPLGAEIRWQILASTPEDTQSLRSLGTYGFIRNPAAYLAGALQPGKYNLEDFGYLAELFIFRAVELGVASCWLGGTFTKSRFARKIKLQRTESLPAVISLGYPADTRAWLDRASRVVAGSDRRLAWEEIFHRDSYPNPLPRQEAGVFTAPLEAVRLAPSASNRQPWRVILKNDRCHFYLHRTPNYLPVSARFVLGLADLQRVDAGIAMAHFQAAAAELGQPGRWIDADPGLDDSSGQLEYRISWTQ